MNNISIDFTAVIDAHGRAGRFSLLDKFAFVVEELSEGHRQLAQGALVQQVERHSLYDTEISVVVWRCR